MVVATTFLSILQVLAAEMIKPTFRRFTTLLAACAAANNHRHGSCFGLRTISCDVSPTLRLCQVVDRSGGVGGLRFNHRGHVVHLVGDDKLIPRTGLKVFGAGMHRDPTLSSRGVRVVRWGHCWIVLCVIIKSRWTPGRVFALPVLVRLYFNKKLAANWNRVYRKKTDLMLDMLLHVARSEKLLHFVADSSFTVPTLLQRMPNTIAVTDRVVMKVRVHQPPPEREPGQTGRPRRRGDRLTALAELLQAKGLHRLTMQLHNG